MDLLPDTLNCALCMRRECRERFPRHLHQRKPLVSDPGMHHGTCATHVPWCLSGSLSCGGGENFRAIPGLPGACATRNFTYLVRGPCSMSHTWFCFALICFGYIISSQWIQAMYLLIVFIQMQYLSLDYHYHYHYYHHYYILTIVIILIVNNHYYYIYHHYHHFHYYHYSLLPF